jgi:ketosteroid isomerase-like protein
VKAVNNRKDQEMAANADVVNGAYESFGRGDIPGVVETVDEGVQWDSTESLPQGGSYSGQDGVVKFFEAVGGAWDGLQIELEDLLESGDKVVAVGQGQGELKGSGSAGYGFVHVFTLNDGKIVRFREYAAPDEALRGS